MNISLSNCKTFVNVKQFQFHFAPFSFNLVHTPVHRTTLTQVCLKFAAQARALNMTFVSTLESSALP